MLIFSKTIKQKQMNSTRKRTSLAEAKQQNNLKDMLQYYNDISQLRSVSSPFQPIYEYQEIHTQKVILPKTAKENLILSLPKNTPIANRQHIDRPDHIEWEAEGENRKTKPSYSRENLAEMHSRLRKIRTSHMRRVSQKMHEQKQHRDECGFDSTELLTTREALTKSSEFISRKVLFTPYGQRAINHIIEETPRSETMAHSQKVRPSSVNTRNDGSLRLRNRGFPVRNAHVIYQFESHLKAKRVDDNPKVLGSIIRKKFGQMDKEQLYGYINTLIKRRVK